MYICILFYKVQIAKNSYCLCYKFSYKKEIYNAFTFQNLLVIAKNVCVIILCSMVLRLLLHVCVLKQDD